MKTIVGTLVLASVLCGAHAQTNSNKSRAWPHQIPCRIHDGSNKDLFIAVLGDVETPLADGVYDPANDSVSLKDGSIKSNYYRDTLGLKYFKPVDKSRFPVPPSGWCSWYYYYSDITEEEVRRNAQWIAEHLKDYGAQYVQIDDGWQGTGRVKGRDWTSLGENFRGGMASLASYIKSLGLTPGIWLAPHGQSNEAVVKKNPGVFLLKPDGTSASESWEGRFLVDPSAEQSEKYLTELFTTISNWGYEYFKIDGQPVVVGEYKAKKTFMKNPPDDPVPLYRNTVETIRRTIGPDRYLLGCWGMPVEGLGIMNGSRTGGDVVLGWTGGFTTALRATMQQYYLHNIAWYCDPDVMLVRSPLTLDQARAWATLQGLTGQALMSSDRVMDLSDERVDLLRRVYPAVDIRPLDLFPSERNKRIWDLKIKHLARSYDVVGFFNFDESKSEQIRLNWKELGLSDTARIHVFDFWNKEYLGSWENGMTVNVSPASCRVLTLLPSEDHVQLISTSRHITQGWVDLIAERYDEQRSSYTGTSKLIKNDAYELRFVFPRGKNFAVKKATARASFGRLPVKITNHQGWATVQILAPRTAEATWEVLFEPSDLYHYSTREPTNLSVERAGLDGARLRWSPQYYLNAGYRVYLNGKPLGYTQNASFPLTELDPNLEYTAEVETIWEDGTASQKRAAVKFTINALLPSEMFLSELEPVRGSPRGNFGRAISVSGKRYERSLAARPASEIEFELHGLFNNFTAQVAVDDAANQNSSVEFVIVGDGKELWRSGALNKSDGTKAVTVSLAGVNRLLLRVISRGGIDRTTQADWLDPKIASPQARQ